MPYCELGHTFLSPSNIWIIVDQQTSKTRRWASFLEHNADNKGVYKSPDHRTTVYVFSAEASGYQYRRSVNGYLPLPSQTELCENDSNNLFELSLGDQENHSLASASVLKILPSKIILKIARTTHTYRIGDTVWQQQCATKHEQT